MVPGRVAGHLVQSPFIFMFYTFSFLRCKRTRTFPTSTSVGFLPPPEQIFLQPPHSEASHSLETGGCCTVPSLQPPRKTRAACSFQQSDLFMSTVHVWRPESEDQRTWTVRDSNLSQSPRQTDRGFVLRAVSQIFHRRIQKKSMSTQKKLTPANTQKTNSSFQLVIGEQDGDEHSYWRGFRPN